MTCAEMASLDRPVPGESIHSAALRALTAVLLAASPDAPEEQLGVSLDHAERLLPGAGTQDVTALRAAALSLRVDTSRLRRRQFQLQAMLQTAQRLLRTAATDDLFEVIIGATQEMLSSDVAHLNLLGAESEADRQRATQGELTEAFRRYRSPGAAGVTGVVRATKSPYVAYDYLRDTRIMHDPAADAAVVADGVRTMAGVPLLQGDDVIGVLVASYRSPTEVSRDQLSIMASLASLAVLALEADSVMRQKVAALSDLRRANDRTRELNSQLEWASSMHDRLTNLVLSGADLNAVAREVARAFNGPVSIVDPGGTVLGAAPPEAAIEPPLHGLDTVRTTGQAAPAVRSDGRTVWMSPAIAAGELLALVVVGRDTLSDLERRALDRAGVVSALLLAIQRWLLEAESQHAAETVSDLISGGARAATASRQARSLGLETNNACVILVADGGASVRSDLQRQARVFARARGGLTGEGAGRVTMLLRGSDPERMAEEFARACTGALAGRVTIGAAGPTESLDGFALAFGDALRCVKGLERLGQAGRVATPISLGFAGLLLADSSSQKGHVEQYIVRTIGPVLDYDSRRDSRLVETVDSYFANKSSLRAAADALHVHPNTVLQRLQRVATLLGSDWLEPDRALEIQLALRLHRVSRPG